MVDDLKEKLAYGGNTEGNKLLIFNKKHYKSKYIAIDINDNGDIMLTCSYKLHYLHYGIMC